MQKVILSIFCPALVAIVLRIAFVLFGFSLFGIGHVYELGKDFLGIVEHNIAYFNSFTWDSSWPYWILVVIITFFLEMSIWDDSADNKQKPKPLQKNVLLHPLIYWYVYISKLSIFLYRMACVFPRESYSFYPISRIAVFRSFFCN